MVAIKVKAISEKETDNAKSHDFDLSAYRFKRLIPIGLYIINKCRIKQGRTRQNRVLSALGELYGGRNAGEYYKLHRAYKLALTLSAIVSGGSATFFAGADKGVAVFCLAATAAVFVSVDSDLFSRAKKRRESIRKDFPGFVSKIVLLVNSGMTITRAWERASGEGGKEGALYVEHRKALTEIKSGCPEHKAYEDFAKSCRLPEVTRFVSMIIQNLKKGNSELVPVLRLFAVDCWEMRKNNARRLGEEASTKLLLPLILMFIAIILIVGTPAVLALRGI